MIRIFCGYDRREAVGLHVFNQSIIDTSSHRFSLTPIYGEQADGTNAFTWERFRIPEMCDYKGFAIWLDGADMLVRHDINDLWMLRDSQCAIQVVKHDYKTKSRIKYIGTELESPNTDYPRKNWSSLVIWNCAHPVHRRFKPDQRFSWVPNDLIGALPTDWNVLVGEQPIQKSDKIRHFTLGIPYFEHYKNDPGAAEWWDCYHAIVRNNDVR